MGLIPTGIVATTLFDTISNTETVLDPKFAMYAYCADTGVAIMVAVTGLVPLFMALNDEISPIPVAGKPMEGILFTQ